MALGTVDGRASQHAFDGSLLWIDAEITSGTSARVHAKRLGVSCPEHIVRVRALIDTAADHTMIDPRAMARLGTLPVSCVIELRGLGRPKDSEWATCRAHEIAIRLPDGGVFSSVEVAVTDLGHADAELLLGMDVLAHCVLIANGPAKVFRLQTVSPPDLIRADRTESVTNDEALRRLEGAV